MSKLDLDKFEAVIFDLDSTLIDTHRYPIVAIHWLLTKLGIESEEIMASYLRNLVTRYRKAIQEIVEGAPYRSAYEIVHTAMKQSLGDINQRANSPLVMEAANRFKDLHIELSTPNDRVNDILNDLERKGLKLGVLSNAFAGNARIILSNLELDHYFSSIVDCGDVSAFKPMAAPFERVLKDLKTEPSIALYIGDEYYADVVGAKLLGITTVWINNRGVSLEDQVAKYGANTTPDFVLNSISEFAELY
ncbi:MAG: HAD family hydrolase [Candidatus Thorarchaeota archaeon]